jgi:hypothetical protein
MCRGYDQEPVVVALMQDFAGTAGGGTGLAFKFGFIDHASKF